MIELSNRFLYLLTQKIKRGYLFSADVISVDMNVVSDDVGGPKSAHAARNQQIFRCNSLNTAR